MTVPITEADREKAREIIEKVYDATFGAFIAAALAQARAEGEAAEREACARIIDENMETVALQSHKRTLAPRLPGDLVGTAYATAIRARGQTHD